MLRIYENLCDMIFYHPKWCSGKYVGLLFVQIIESHWLVVLIFFQANNLINLSEGKLGYVEYLAISKEVSDLV